MALRETHLVCHSEIMKFREGEGITTGTAQRVQEGGRKRKRNQDT